MFFRNVTEMSHKSIQTLNSILCRSPFGSCYSSEASKGKLYRLLTLWFMQWIQFILTDHLKLHQTGWEVSETPSSCPSTDVLHGLSLGFGGLTQGLTYLLQCHSTIVLFVCFWIMVILRDKPSPQAQVPMYVWSRFSSMTSLYLAAFILP